MVLGFCLGLVLTSCASAQSPPERLTHLHDALHLTASQEQAWGAYTTAIAQDPQSAARRQATQRLLPQLSTPRRIALIDATMAQDMADFRHQGEAVTTFYNRLTPEQQVTFDRETSPANGDQSDQ